MDIDVAELQRVANLLFERLKSTEQSRFELTEGYYWDIDDESLYNPNQPPPPDALSLGDLLNDWEEIQTVGRSHDPLPGHDLRHLVGLLRFVAASAVP